MEILNLTMNPFREDQIVVGDSDYAAELLLRLEPDGSATIEAHEVYDPDEEPVSGWVGDGWEWRERFEKGQSFVVEKWAIQSDLPKLAALLKSIHQGTGYTDEMDPEILEMSDEAIDAEAKVTAELRGLGWAKGPVYLVHPDDWLVSGDMNAEWLFGDVPNERILDPKQEDNVIEELAEQALQEANDADVVFETPLEDALRKLLLSRRHELQKQFEQGEEQ